MPLSLLGDIKWGICKSDIVPAQKIWSKEIS